jgi:nitric oxide reductase NorD protein
VTEQRAKTPTSGLFDAPPPPEEEGISYDEWDDAAGVYRAEATKILPMDAPTGGLEPYQRIVEANRRAIQEIRRRFEALRAEERWLHGQRDGSELDLNRLVVAMTDIHAGQQPDDRIFKRFVRQKQPVAILTMVDLSGSTAGRVLYAEQEAMVLFAEGLKTLGMPHAFYGFSNTHPLRCEFQRIKAFEDGYDDAVHKRLGNLRAGGATRLGTFVRHATRLLSMRPQSRRILFILSDGKPEDRGEYRGSYGVKDTAMAVLEARHANVHPFCFSLDPAENADSYLEPIFGKNGYLKVGQVELLPRRLPEVFRRMVR